MNSSNQYYFMDKKFLLQRIAREKFILKNDPIPKAGSFYDSLYAKAAEMRKIYEESHLGRENEKESSTMKFSRWLLQGKLRPCMGTNRLAAAILFF